MEIVKVVHIITKMELGGAQQNTLFTVRHLNPKRFHAYLVAGNGGELFQEAKSFQNSFFVPDLIREIMPLRDLRAFFQLRDILRRIMDSPPSLAPLIVHTHSSKAGVIGRWAAKSLGISPIIHSIHGFGFNDYQPFLVQKAFMLTEKITSKITQKFIAVSKANIQKGISHKIFSSFKVTLIRSGIDIESFKKPRISRDEMRRNLGIPCKTPVVAMVACLKPQKSPLDFIRVCELISREVPDTAFLLVGDGVLRESIEKEVKKRGLQKKFQLLGWRRDVREILHTIDILVLTSLWEGLPRIFPQAAAAGVPIVATRVDGAPEIVREGKNGFLVAPGDVKGMAERVILLLKHPFKAKKMGKNGLELVREFDIYRMLGQIESLYEEVLQPKKCFCSKEST